MASSGCSPRKFLKDGIAAALPATQGLTILLGCLMMFLVLSLPTHVLSFREQSGLDQGGPRFRGGTQSTNVYALAYEESGGFFDDVREADWALLKDRIRQTPECAKQCEGQPANVWLQDNWEPNFTCLHERRVGRWGDGGKWVCDPHRIARRAEHSHQPCLVYSVGSNNDFSFEEAVLRDVSPTCEIHTFDPTIGDHPSNLPANGKISFHPWGLAQADSGDFKTMATIRTELGHVHRQVDILKIDCEGCEWDTYKSWFDNVDVPPRQILIELHKGTEGSSPVMAMEFMRHLKDRGYVIFHKEPNTLGCLGSCIEYAFVRVDAFDSSSRQSV